jgi:Spy/CpxP family protein refolding chaperone
MRKGLKTILAAGTILFLCAGSCAYAQMYQGKGMPQGHFGKGAGPGSSLEGKVLRKLSLILEHRQLLNLSDEQVEKLNKLKLDTQKELIRKDADIQAFSLDIDAELKKDSVNVKAVRKLLDKKYKVKSAKALSLVRAYADIKDTLSDEQKQALMSLWKKGKEEMGKMSGCPKAMMGAGMMKDMMMEGPPLEEVGPEAESMPAEPAKK